MMKAVRGRIYKRQVRFNHKWLRWLNRDVITTELNTIQNLPDKLLKQISKINYDLMKILDDDEAEMKKSDASAAKITKGA